MLENDNETASTRLNLKWFIRNPYGVIRPHKDTTYKIIYTIEIHD